MSASAPQLEVGSPPPAERLAALALALSHVPRSEREGQIARLQAQAATEPELWDGLVSARRAGRVVGAISAQLQPGRTAFLSLPHLFTGEDNATAARLLQQLVAMLDARSVQLVQALLTADYGDDFELLRGPDSSTTPTCSTWPVKPGHFQKARRPPRSISSRMANSSRTGSPG